MARGVVPRWSKKYKKPRELVARSLNIAVSERTFSALCLVLYLMLMLGTIVSITLLSTSPNFYRHTQHHSPFTQLNIPVDTLYKLISEMTFPDNHQIGKKLCLSSRGYAYSTSWKVHTFYFTVQKRCRKFVICKRDRVKLLKFIIVGEAHKAEMSSSSSATFLMWPE